MVKKRLEDKDEFNKVCTDFLGPNTLSLAIRMSFPLLVEGGCLSHGNFLT